MDALPGARKLLEPEALAKIGRLTLESRQPMQGSVAGKHKSPHRGSSVEFAEYREYLPGDDLRRLDWRAYGRSDRFYIKEFEAETNLRLVMVVDSSGSMRYGHAKNKGNGSSKLSKLEFASRMAALLGFVAIRQGDAAGLAVASGKGVTHLAPKRRPSHLALLQDKLEALEPSGGTTLEEVLHEVAERTRQRAMIVIFSDFFLDPEKLNGCFQHLRFRKHDVVAFHLLERRELEFDFQSTTRFVDLEGGASYIAEPAHLAKHYAKALADYLEGLADAVRKADVDYHRALLESTPEDVLAEFLLPRMQGRRGR